MKNYVYISRNQATIKIYYTRAKTKDLAVLKIGRLSNTPVNHYWYIKDDIKELSDIEQIYEYDYPDYEG